MIAGETRTVRHTETAEAAFTFDGTPTLAVTQPDGTALSPDPTVSVSPGTADETQTLSAPVAFDQAGVYRFAWSMAIGDEDPITRIETYFAAWSDVYTEIRRLLSRSALQLPDAAIDPTLARITRRLIALFPCLVSYNALTGEEQAFFDDALLHFAAAALRPTLSSVATGEVKRRKQRDQEIEYAVSGSSGSANLTKDWETYAWEQLRFIACIGYTTPLDTEGVTLVLQPTSILSPTRYYDESEWATARGLL